MKNFRKPQLRPKKNTLVAGRDAVLEALESGKALDRIYMQSTLHGEPAERIRAAAEKNGVPVNKVPVEKLNSFNISNHQGCVAVISRIRYLDLQDVVSFVVESGEVPLFVLLDGITDIRNIGAIARSAYCLGAQALVIPDRGVGALNEDALLTSAGALEKLAVCRVGTLLKAVDDLHLNGIRVYAAEMKGDSLLMELELSLPSAIVLGGEEQGIHPALLKRCDGAFRIPMPVDFDSLNVSVANGIILYEASRQRRQV